MGEVNNNFFVVAAVIAAEVDKATYIAKGLSLTASNARAVAHRAGDKAAGFRPLTDYIDRLAILTINSSKKINKLAAQLSRTAANKFRSNNAIERFEQVYVKAKDSQYITSLDFGYQRTQIQDEVLSSEYSKQVDSLTLELSELRNELRTAVILSTLSRVEASHADAIYQVSLNNVAENVQSASIVINQHILNAEHLLDHLHKEK